MSKKTGLGILTIAVTVFFLSLTAVNALSKSIPPNQDHAAEVRNLVEQYMTAVKAMNLEQLKEIPFVGKAAKKINLAKMNEVTWEEVQEARERFKDWEWEIVDVQVDMTINQAKASVKQRGYDSDEWAMAYFFFRFTGGKWAIYDFSAEKSDREAQAITVDRIRELGMAIEQYILDHARTGAPKTNDIDDLYDILLQEEIIDAMDSEEVIDDGWGNPLIYKFDTTNIRHYEILSLGSDGKPGPAPQQAGIVERHIEDIIWKNGAFTQRPEVE